MEGCESEKVFEKLNLNPQLFFNETLNRVDALIYGSFHHFHLEASKLLKTDGTDMSEDLKDGIKVIRNKVHVFLDNRLSVWEDYCLRHCFSVPSGFSLPLENETPDEDPMDKDDISDEQAEAQLDTLRSKLVEARKECSELNQELMELETKSSWTNHSASAVNEALQLYDSSSSQGVVQEMLRVATELRQKLDQLKTKHKEDSETVRRERVDVANEGLGKLKSDVLQEFIAEMNL